MTTEKINDESNDNGASHCQKTILPLNTIKDFILNENKITTQEQPLIEPFIDYFNYTNMFNNKEWDLSIYKKYIDMPYTVTFHNTHDSIENIDIATKLLMTYINANKRVFIITDNDLDGSAANAIAKATSLFISRKFNKKNIFSIHFAYGESHGISFEQINTLVDNKAEDFLIITADNGINNREEIIKIKNTFNNVKIIITDHHIANEEEQVFDLVNVVINPEAISLNTSSQITQFKLNDTIMSKTSISGAHTFYLLIKQMLLSYKIKNKALEDELKLIALFSNIGDLVKYHLDIQNDISINMTNFAKKMQVFKYHINNLNVFNQIPEKNINDKLQDLCKEITTNFNSIRRLNSLLMTLNKIEDPNNTLTLEEWFQTHFECDVNNPQYKIGEETIKEFLIRANTTAKKALEYFGDSLELKDNYYSYIKNIIPYALMSIDSNKTEKDVIFLNEITTIINDFNVLKKILRTHIMEQNLYGTYKNDYFELYYSGKGSILREILSIQVFIEAKENIPYLNIAQNNPYEVKGSMRSPSFFPFKKLMIEDERVEIIKKEQNIDIKILGHTDAAGILFTRDNGTNPISIEEVIAFFQTLEPMFKEEMESKEQEKPIKFITLNLKDFSSIDVEKLQRVLNSYLYVGINPFFHIPKIKFKVQELKELLNLDYIALMTSKKGNKYFSTTTNNLIINYFGDEKDLNEAIDAYGAFTFKFHWKEKRFLVELNVSVKPLEDEMETMA